MNKFVVQVTRIELCVYLQADFVEKLYDKKNYILQSSIEEINFLSAYRYRKL